MFFGGLVALEQIARTQVPDQRQVNNGPSRHRNGNIVTTPDSTTNTPAESIGRLAHARSNKSVHTTGIADGPIPVWRE
jgi:hypothetical protein